MRLINTKAHAALDYLLGTFLVFCPLIFDFRHVDEARNACAGAGIFIFMLALITRFEWSLKKAVPLNLHLWLDLVAGLLLAASPWLLGFQQKVIKPHLVFGLCIATTSVLTDRILYQQYKRSLGQSSHKDAGDRTKHIRQQRS